MKPNDRVAVVTGAGSGIGKAVASELAHRGARAVAVVDRSESVREVASEVNHAQGRQVLYPFVGDTTDPEFRRHVYDQIGQIGRVSICVPAAGITRDALAVKIDKQTGKVVMYPESQFRQVVEVNLVAPTYWAMEMVARVAEDRYRRKLGRWDPEEKIQAVAIFIGSVSSQGNKGQIAYAATKRGLEGAAATLMKEAIFYGVRCAVIHPGFTDTPMVRAMGDKLINENILPYTQLRRLIRPEEIAEAICFMISNEAVSGELWADAGWHPSA
jgi:NAD(P)-dependent dehydrogenase (short-subunit alcohol dehydrogenase family)